MKKIPKYTIGMGDRFGEEGQAQLEAVQFAVSKGIGLCPVWNKSFREHSLIGTRPEDLRIEADQAVAALGWDAPYFVDADHINLHTVDSFIESSDFFTIDVADYVGKSASPGSIDGFLHRHSTLVGSHRLSNLADPVVIGMEDMELTAAKFLWAIEEAGRIHRRIASQKNNGPFAIEVSVDETDTPQTPAELFLILAMVADEGIPAQTIAPKFTGRFNKGVDYVGDLVAFEREFDADLAVIAHAIDVFGLPETLKISVHSGSDKFSLYPVIRRLISKHNSGLHLKTAGTTWLEEVIGLAESGGSSLELVKQIYRNAIIRADELIKPYAPVVDIDISKLPSADVVATWSSEKFVSVLEHNRLCSEYDSEFRQFIHVSFKIAAAIGQPYLDALRCNRTLVSRRVKDNLVKNHITPIFL